MEVSVVIATLGRPDSLAGTLVFAERAARVAGGGHEIVVVDNGADDRTWEAVRVFAARSLVPVVYERSPPGDKCAALNRGIRRARHDWLAFTDDDTEPAADWLQAGIRFASSGGTRAFGGRVVPRALPSGCPRWLRPGPSGRVPSGAIVRYDPQESSGRLNDTVPVPLGANFFMHRAVVEAHGGYDETLWRLCGRAALGVDDGEFGVRLRTRGEALGYCRDAVVVHPVHAQRLSLIGHMRMAYRYGWRDPFVFFDPARPRVEWFRLRRTGSLSYSVLRRSINGDAAAAVCDLCALASTFGGAVGRQSRAYREWTRIQRQRAGGRRP